MPFEPGSKKPEKSGRKKGQLNQKTEHFFEMCARNNHDPVEFNVFLAKNDWKAVGYESPTITVFTKSGDSYEQDRITIQDRISANNKLLDFMYPKRKAIEIQTDDKNTGMIFMAYDPKNMKKPDEQG